MTDRQKLVYDLSMQLTAAELAKGIPLSENPAAYALDTFTGYIALYSAMDPANFDIALAKIKKVQSLRLRSANLSMLFGHFPNGQTT